jgi:hypothetical protein
MLSRTLCSATLVLHNSARNVYRRLPNVPVIRNTRSFAVRHGLGIAVKEEDKDNDVYAPARPLPQHAVISAFDLFSIGGVFGALLRQECH